MHGKSITAEEIEWIVSRQFNAQTFASLCNSIAWVSAGLRCANLPSFTERVNAKDGGIDAEWHADFPNDNNYASPLIGPGWNVYQYKQRDIFAQGRDKTFSNLLAGLKGAIVDLHHATGRRPNRYVLFINLDLTHFEKGQKGKLRETILEGYDQPHTIHTEIVGAAELAPLLNDAPHLRSAFFIPSKFETWQRYHDAHMRQKLYGKNIKLVGRDKELKDIRSLVDDPSVRAITITGPHNIGKTRLALQATDHRPIETVVAIDPHSISISDLLSLESPGSETIILIEDPDPEKVEKFVAQALVREGIKLLITLPTEEDVPTPNFGRDKRVQHIRLGPLAEEQAKELLQTVGTKFDFSIESWVIEQSGGNPGILLLAATLGPELKKTTKTFADDVASAFEKQVRHELGDDAIETLQLLSMLAHVGIKGTASKEIELICSVFGSKMQYNAVLKILPRLEKAGIVLLRGSFAEVLPPLFAHKLASTALHENFYILYVLLVGLEQAGRLRLIGRLRNINSREVTLFWEELFADDGPFKDIASTLTYGYLLRLVASAAPEKVASFVEGNLKALSQQERLTIAGKARRELMWILEELLFRKKTSAAAVRCLAMIAEAETEDCSNNATGVFIESFDPLHPQLPLPLHDRLSLLKDLFSPQNTVESRLIGIKTIESAFDGMKHFRLRRSSGAEPLDCRPSMTYNELWNYLDSLVDLLMATAQSNESVIAAAARTSLPRVLSEYASLVRPTKAIEHFKTLVNDVLTKKINTNISDLSSALKSLHRWLSEKKNKCDEKHAEGDNTECLDQIEALINLIEKGDYITEVKKWAGNRTHEDHEYEVEDNGHRVYRFEKELKSLAEEAVKNPEVLTDELLSWLCIEEALKSHIYFWWLGKLDIDKKLLPTIKAIAAKKGGAGAFSPYIGGISHNDRTYVNELLDRLADSNEVTGEAIVKASSWLNGDLAGVKRVIKIITQEKVDPVFVRQTLNYCGWLKTLKPDEFILLSKSIAGAEMKNAAEIIEFFGLWIHEKRPIEGELADFAWTCLEATPSVKGHQPYDFDRLARKLAEFNIERAFHLLEKLLTLRDQREYWNPICNYRETEFWRFLHEVDRKRSLYTVLSLALENPDQCFGAVLDLEEVIDQERDADLLIEFALEFDKHAEIVCWCISSGRPGFWPVAFKIFERYQNNSEIRNMLERGITQTGSGHFIEGPWSAHLQRCRLEIENLLNDSSTPTAARLWLEQIDLDLCNQADHHAVAEMNEEIDDLQRMPEDPASPERLWAIKKLLDMQKIDQILKLVPKAELLALLPKLQLSEMNLQQIKENKNL